MLNYLLPITMYLPSTIREIKINEIEILLASSNEISSSSWNHSY